MPRKKSEVEVDIKKTDAEFKKLKKERDTILHKGIGQVADARKKALKAIEDAKKTIDQCDLATKNMKKTVQINDDKIDKLVDKLEKLVKEKQAALPG